MVSKELFFVYHNRLNCNRKVLEPSDFTTASVLKGGQFKHFTTSFLQILFVCSQFCPTYTANTLSTKLLKS